MRKIGFVPHWQRLRFALGQIRRLKPIFKTAMLWPTDPYLLGAYSDLLLAQGRNAEVADLLKNETLRRRLLFALALAESALKPQPETLPAHIDSLSARYESGHLRGDSLSTAGSTFDLALLHNAAGGAAYWLNQLASPA